MKSNTPNSEQTISESPDYKYTLITVVLFEIYFIYSEIIVYLKIPTYSLWWLFAFLQIGLGYAVYRLYIIKKSKLWILGLVLQIAGLAPTFSAFLTQLMGGYVFFALTLNSLFLVRYFRDKGKIKYGSKWNIIGIIAIIIASVDALTGFNNGFYHLILLLMWISFYLQSEGIIKQRNPYK